jgi:tetratricopeptide (TPR) repeat protein
MNTKGDDMVKALQQILVALCALAVAPTTGAGGIDDLEAGTRAHNQGNYDEALRLYTKAITAGELAPQYVQALRQRAAIWTEHKKDFDRGIADLSESLRLDPQDAASLAHRGSAWREKKDFERAIADYSEAILVDPKETFAWNRRGVVYLMLGDYRAAIADFNSAIKIWPEDSNSLFGRGLARRMMGDQAGGEADMAAATKAYPPVAESYERDGVQIK